MDCISLLIIGIVIIGVVRSSSRNTKQNESKKMMKNLENAVLENARKRAMEQGGMQQRTPVQTYTQTQQRMSDPQRTKSVYEKQTKVYTYQNSGAARQQTANDILARANRNVMEQEAEREKPEVKEQKVGMTREQQTVKAREQKKQQLIQQKLEQTKSAEQVAAENDSEDLMRDVEDLMIMGYDGTLEFERDFVAEGVDMLNRIQM